MTETERDMEERIRAILGVTGAPLDVSTRILELIEWGDIVRVEAPGESRDFERSRMRIVSGWISFGSDFSASF